MAFIMNKLLQKKTPARKLTKPFPKLEGNDLNNGRVTLTLGELKTTFCNGEWIPEYSRWNETNRENSSLKMKITRLEEENNILKLKYEILLDIVARESRDLKNAFVGN